MGVDRSTVTKWETSHEGPPHTLLPQIAEYLGVTVEWLNDPKTTEPKQAISVSKDTDLAFGFSATMAIRSWRGVMATITDFEESDFVQEDHGEVATAFLVNGPRSAESHDLVRVSGRSMWPRIRPGDHVLIFRDDNHYQDSIVFAQSPDGRMVVKVLREVGGHWELHSIAPEGATFKDLTGWKVYGWAVIVIRDGEQGEPNIEWNFGKPLRHRA